MRAHGQRLHAAMVAAALLLAVAVATPQTARADGVGAPAGLRRGLSVRFDAGEGHACAIRDDGALVCWGDNRWGELGLGDDSDRGDGSGELPASAVPVGARRTAVAVSARGSHTCALRDNGSVICWGHNAAGQLGLGDTAPRGAAPNELPTPRVPLGTGRTATAIAAGRHHTCALLDDGSVTCWGDNRAGQLGLGDTDHRGDAPGELPTATVNLGAGRTATAIVAGALHTCALRDDGSFICWGDNEYGTLGIGTTDTRGDETGELPTPAVPLGEGRAVIAMAAGDHFNCVLRDDRSIVCWGDNGDGQLGAGHDENRGDEPDETFSPVALGEGRTAVAISAGHNHGCAVRDDGSVVCWGFNLHGQLGVGDTEPRGDEPDELPIPPVPLAGGRPAIAISSGADLTCALRDNGSLVCWGHNASGEVGVGNTEMQGDEPDDLPTPPVPLGGSIRTPALRIANASVTEGTGSTRYLVFAVTRATVAGHVSVRVETAGGNATAGDDYEPVTTRISLRSGTGRTNVRIAVIPDAVPEGRETVIVRLSDPRGATIADRRGVGIIRDND